MDIGYYTSYNPKHKSPCILDKIQQQWGSRLERMTYEQKIIMRAALAGYIAQKPVHHESDSVNCIDGCIESAGVDWNVWDDDELLVETIQQCGWLLSEEDIEGLIEALTAQIRAKIYASRTEAWEVLTA